MSARSFLRFVGWSGLAAAVWGLAARRLLEGNRASTPDTVVVQPSSPPRPVPDDAVDEAIAESFPASDPPAYPTRRED